jgi:CheY-like chemotaxis protein
MEFLLFPISGLVFATIIFLATNSDSRRFAFYVFYLVGVICLVMSLLTYLISSPEERLLQPVTFHGIFAVLGLAGIIFALVAAQSQERLTLSIRVMEERQNRAASEITQLAASNSTLPELLNFAQDKIVKMLGFSGGAIHVFHRARESLVLGSYTGLSARLARRLETIEFGDTSIGRTAKNKRLLIIRDLRLSQDYEFFGGKQEGFSYMALIPILAEGENWGVISLFGKGQYQPGSLQVDLLEQFGEQLGAALGLGRQVRSMQAAKENLSFLFKTVAQELADQSAAKAGLGVARSLGWSMTRFFGGDRFDICTKVGDGWVVLFSSDTAYEGKRLSAAYDLNAGPMGGIIEYNQTPPFAEFSGDRSYLYSSLHMGRDWLFIRLEGRRRGTTDHVLLSDSFKIIHGLFTKLDAAAKTAARQAAARPAESRREGRPESVAMIAENLDRLLRQYADLRDRPEMQELFVWLESILKSARETTGPKSAILPRRAGGEIATDTESLIRETVEAFLRASNGSVKIDFVPQNELPIPAVPEGQMRHSLIEFLTSALFDTENQGALKLWARGDDRSIVFELQGEKLAQPPIPNERPTWLRQINGRLESRHIETEQGQAVESWRLHIPAVPAAGPANNPDEPVRVLVVDRQDVIRDLLSTMLAGLGHSADGAASASDALALFRASVDDGRPYGIIVADYTLDTIAGTELAQQIKALWPEIRFVLLIGWGMALDQDEARSRGVDYVLSKPFRLEQLAEAIRTVTVTSGPR